MFFKMLAISLITGDSPDDWDIRDIIFSLISFKLGMIGAAPLALIWNLLVSDIEDPMHVIPVQPRQMQFGLDVANYVFSPGNNRVNDSWYLYQKASKNLIGVDLAPHSRRRYNSLEDKIMPLFPLLRPFYLPSAVLETINE